MGRGGKRNVIVTEEKWAKVLPKNKDLLNEFLGYFSSIDRSAGTVMQYEKQLQIFFTWNMEFNANKFFVDVKKKDFVRYFGYCQNTLESSPNRMATLRAVLSSLSKYIEVFNDDEYPTFRSNVSVIELPTKVPVRKKTVLEQDDIQRALDELIKQGKYQIACFLSLAVACGARKAELCRFKTSYFKDEYVVYGCLYETPEEIVTKGRGKHGKLLKKYTFVKQFKPYFELWMKERERLGIDSEWLFVTKREQSWVQAQPATAAGWAHQISDILGVDFYCHACRHLWCTNLKKEGLPDDIIAALQGWESVEMCKTYNDASVSDNFGKYFGEDGIKKIDTPNLRDM